EAARAYLEQAFSECGRRRVPSIRVEPEGGGGRAVYVASKRIDGLEPATVAVRIHEERLDDAALFEALRDKFDLTARDRRVMMLLRQGHDNASVARSLGLTLGTTKVYVHELFTKMGVHSRGELLGVLDRVRKGPARGGRQRETRG